VSLPLLYLIGGPNYDFVSGRVAILLLEFHGNHWPERLVSGRWVCHAIE